MYKSRGTYFEAKEMLVFEKIFYPQLIETSSPWRLHKIARPDSSYSRNILKVNGSIKALNELNS